MNVRPIFAGLTFAAALAFPQGAPAAQVSMNSAPSCRDVEGRALAAIGDALTSGTDADVLQAALGAQKHLQACGLPRDAVSAQLVSADAYGDTNKPQSRCSALRDARTRSLRLHDSARAAMIGRALSKSKCR